MNVIDIDEYLAAIERMRETARRNAKKNRREERRELLAAILLAVLAVTPWSFLMAALAAKVAGG